MISLPVFWRMLRPHTLSASFIPVTVGTALAFKAAGTVRWELFLTMLLASMFIQIATNLFNEYYDYIKGLDTAESVGIGGTIVRDGLAPRTVFLAALIFLAAAGVLGLFIAWRSTWLLIPIGGLCMLCGYLYTGGPYPIANSPFGELASGLLLGTLVICISFYIQTDLANWQPVAASLPVAVLISAILTSNNIRDRVGDAANRRRTLVILLGHRRGVLFLACLFAFAFFWTIALCFWPNYGVWFLLPLLALPHAFQAVRIFQLKENSPPGEMMPAMKRTAQTNSAYGFCYALAILLSTFS